MGLFEFLMTIGVIGSGLVAMYGIQVAQTATRFCMYVDYWDHTKRPVHLCNYAEAAAFGRWLLKNKREAFFYWPESFGVFGVRVNRPCEALTYRQFQDIYGTMPDWATKRQSALRPYPEGKESLEHDREKHS